MWYSSRRFVPFLVLGLVVSVLGAGDQVSGFGLDDGPTIHYHKSSRVPFSDGQQFAVTIESDSFTLATSVTGATYLQDPDQTTVPPTVFNPMTWDIVEGLQKAYVSPADNNTTVKIRVVLVARKATKASGPKQARPGDDQIGGTGVLVLTTDAPATIPDIDSNVLVEEVPSLPDPAVDDR